MSVLNDMERVGGGGDICEGFYMRYMNFTFYICLKVFASFPLKCMVLLMFSSDVAYFSWVYNNFIGNQAVALVTRPLL